MLVMTESIMNQHKYTEQFQNRKCKFMFVYATMMSICLIYFSFQENRLQAINVNGKTSMVPLVVATAQGWAHVNGCNHTTPACEEDIISEDESRGKKLANGTKS